MKHIDEITIAKYKMYRLIIFLRKLDAMDPTKEYFLAKRIDEVHSTNMKYRYRGKLMNYTERILRDNFEQALVAVSVIGLFAFLICFAIVDIIK